MYLEEIKLEPFRLFPELRLVPAEGANLFVGENAQGKTTILEAIGYLALGRSFRTNRDRECLPFSPDKATAPFAAIEGRLRIRGSRRKIRLAISPSRKTVWVDDKPLKSLRELWGLLRVVIFVPSDLNLVKGPATSRRVLLDTLLGQVSKSALHLMQSYQSAVKNRNALLRSGHLKNPGAQFDAWEAQIAQYGAKLSRSRARLVARLESLTREHLVQITGGKEELSLLYETGWPKEAELPEFRSAGEEELEPAIDSIRKWLRLRRPDDRDRTYTQHGAHRSDVIFLLNGKDARTFASQGQARSIVLALRLAELQVLNELSGGESPVLLLDDVLGELDQDRGRRFLHLLGRSGVQTFLTATDAHLIEEELPIGKRFEVAGGRVKG